MKSKLEFLIFRSKYCEQVYTYVMQHIPSWERRILIWAVYTVSLGLSGWLAKTELWLCFCAISGKDKPVS